MWCYVLGFLLCLTTPSLAEVFVNRTCESYELQSSTGIGGNFTTFCLKINGTWYETAAYDKSNTTCNLIGNDTSIIRQSQCIVTRVTNDNVKQAILLEMTENGSLNVTTKGKETTVKVLAADYHKYILVWSCSNLHSNISNTNDTNSNITGSLQSLWVLSRNRSSTMENLPDVNKALNLTGIARDNMPLHYIDQTDKTCHIGGASAMQSTAFVTWAIVLNLIIVKTLK